MYDGLRKHVGIPDNINLINSMCHEKKLDLDKNNIVWQHHSADSQYAVEMMNPYFTRQIDGQVYVSHWQFEKYRYLLQIPLENAVVIKNAIEPIEFVKRPTGDKIKLIYTSAPHKGLEILLSVIELLDRDDIELDVYSSTIIYGTDYALDQGTKYEWILNWARTTKNVNLIGCVSNEDVKKALQKAHIWTLPSIFEETSCISMIEAGAAGCKMVTTNIGALFETGSEFAIMSPIQASREEIVMSYAHLLNHTIDQCKAGFKGDERQSDFYNQHYNWENRVPQWEQLFETAMT